MARSRSLGDYHLPASLLRIGLLSYAGALSGFGLLTFDGSLIGSGLLLKVGTLLTVGLLLGHGALVAIGLLSSSGPLDEVGLLSMFDALVKPDGFTLWLAPALLGFCFGRTKNKKPRPDLSGFAVGLLGAA